MSSTDYQTGYRRQSYIQRTYGGWGGLLVSRQVRALLGVLLFGLFALWLVQNKSVPVGDLAHNAANAINEPYRQMAQPWEQAEANRPVPVRDPEKILDLPLVPDFIARLFSTYNVGLAGALLLFSALFGRRTLGLLVLAGAGLICLGDCLQIEQMSPLGRCDSVNVHPTSLILGGLLAGLGLWRFRR